MSSKVIGLTGGIASGKTTASAYFQDLGIPVIDADVIAHELTAPGALGSIAVAADFGADYLDSTGAMDRVKMRHLVFSNPDAKARLEAILHPMIRNRAEDAISAAKRHAKLVIFDCALLLEKPLWRTLVDEVLVIDADEEVRIERLAKRNGFSHDEAARIIAAQLPRDALLAAADTVVTNNTGPEEFLLKLASVYKVWQQRIGI